MQFSARACIYYYYATVSVYRLVRHPRILSYLPQTIGMNKVKGELDLHQPVRRDCGRQMLETIIWSEREPRVASCGMFLFVFRTSQNQNKKIKNKIKPWRVPL